MLNFGVPPERDNVSIYRYTQKLVLKSFELTDGEEENVDGTIFRCFVPCTLNVLCYEGIAFQETSVSRFDVFLDNAI